MKKIFFGILFLSNIVWANNSLINVKDNNDLDWRDMPNSYAKYAVIAGNPKKAEFFIVRIKFPAHYAIRPHHHMNYEYNTVISGSCYIAEGKNGDKTKGVLANKGKLVIIPANTPHYGWTEDEGAIIQLSGIGPWEPIYEKD